MKYIRRSEDRGMVNLGWLQSKHSFSFGDYYDQNHMGVSVLRVINDDIIMPSQGFGTHGHKDMEIISYVVEGALKHQDSTGNRYVVSKGDVQRMSAGRGVMHSEFNASESDHVKLLQIWLHPNVKGIEPSYEQKNIPQRGALTTLVSPTRSDDTLFIHQDASLSRLMLGADETIELSAGKRTGYLHIMKGQITVNGETFNEGDAFATEPDEKLSIKANTPLEALWFDLPLS